MARRGLRGRSRRTCWVGKRLHWECTNGEASGAAENTAFSPANLERTGSFLRRDSNHAGPGCLPRPSSSRTLGYEQSNGGNGVGCQNELRAAGCVFGLSE